jgi:nitrogen fixation-related uncharacterized protein
MLYAVAGVGIFLVAVAIGLLIYRHRTGKYGDFTRF